MTPRRVFTIVAVAFACAACADLLAVEAVEYGAGGPAAPTDAEPGDAGSTSDASADGSVEAGADGGPVSTDGGADGDGKAPPTRVCPNPPSRILCEDFEPLDLDPAWDQNLAEGGAEVVGTRFKSGAQSLHVHTDEVLGDAAGAKRSAWLWRGGVAPTGPFFARIWVWAQSPIALATGQPEIFLGFDGPDSSGVELQLYKAQNAAHLRMTEWPGGGTDPTSASAFPVDQWVCVEWKIDTVAHTSQMWLNGVEETSLGTKALGIASITSMAIGLQVDVRGQQPAYDLWLDDVAVDTARIGCQ